MEVTISTDIKDCRDCLFVKDHSGHGECWTYCSHPESRENILWGCRERFKSVPEWCPLGIK